MTPRKLSYILCTMLVVLVFVGSGIANLVRAEHVAANMLRLGYPEYFMAILGTWKILGALVVVAPGLGLLKEWAYAGMFFDLTGAAASRAAADHGLILVILPLLIAGVLVASWALRPAGRRVAR
jgi:hypothetical protein